MGPDKGRIGLENHRKKKFSELVRLVGKRLVRHVGVLGAIQFIDFAMWIKKIPKLVKFIAM